MEKKGWTRKIGDASLCEHVIPAFLEHIGSMGITPEQITGKVLVIGQGSAFPEKSLIATPKMGFEELRSGVDAVYCCDVTYPSSPELHLPNMHYVNTISYQRIPKPQPNTVYGELSSCYHFFTKTELDFFDTILMFRMVDLGAQITKTKLIETVAPHLRKGGYFIGSGGRFPDTIPANFFQPLIPITRVRLFDHSGGYTFSNNWGVILQK